MSRARNIPYLVEGVTLLGILLYIVRSLYFANSALSIGDEGAYLYKGLLYARGNYDLFQEYGLWTNKAPLAFLIPGYIQRWFGPGLREGRYFAVLASLLMLAGLWISANRLGGKRWAAVAVWVYALSDLQTSTYSLALSQGLVACMLSWVLVCVLGERQKPWQVIVGSLLAVLMVMTRQNMIFFLPMLLYYVFWQYGKRAGIISFATITISFILFHAFYWPNILQLWVPWIPESITPWLEPFRLHFITGVDEWTVSLASRIQSLANGMRDLYFILCGTLLAWVFFPPRRDWHSPARLKSAVFLGVTFLVLFAMHTWASLFKDYCVQCFSSYQLFYSVAGMLFVVAVFSHGIRESKGRRMAGMLVVLIFASVVGTSYFQSLGEWGLTQLRFPRLSTVFSQGGLNWATLGEVLTHRVDLQLDSQKRIAATLVGFLAGVALMGATWLVHRYWMRGTRAGEAHMSRVVLTVFLIAGVIIPPAVYAGVYSAPCSSRFLSHYEEAGRSLAEVIPADSLVYWKGSGRHLALLLYVEEIRVFAPQITAGGGYVVSGERDHLLRFGLFDDPIDADWRKTADTFILWRGYPNLVMSDFEGNEAYLLQPFDMHSLAQCEEKLFIFTRHP